MLVMPNSTEQPKLLVFAGPNGSGKSNVSRAIPLIGTYVNADDLKAEHGLSDLEAAQQAEMLRNQLLSQRLDFSFETVLSTERNLFLMNRAKDAGYKSHCIYVLTTHPDINVSRVISRVATGGHDVPEEKIRARYFRALALIPKVNQLCDEFLLYDNTTTPVLIYSKIGISNKIFPSDFWSEDRIKDLLNNIL